MPLHAVVAFWRWDLCKTDDFAKSTPRWRITIPRAGSGMQCWMQWLTSEMSSSKNLLSMLFPDQVISLNTHITRLVKINISFRSPNGTAGDVWNFCQLHLQGRYWIDFTLRSWFTQISILNRTEAMNWLLVLRIVYLVLRTDSISSIPVCDKSWAF